MKGIIRGLLITAIAGASVAPFALAGVPVASGKAVVTEYVSTKGVDTGNCTQKKPCATINYAISRATPGATINVEAGTYKQTVDVNKAVTIKGAGAKSTTLNGAGLDPSSDNYYGIVYVGNAGGIVTVSGLTIKNPYPYSYTGGEPEAVVLNDPSSSDSINLTGDRFVEGKADPGASSDFPIGLDTFLNAATTTVSNDSFSGFFQGILAEDNGPITVSNDEFTALISNTSGGTTYPAEGVFFLADEGGNYTGQVAKADSFSGYSGYGVAEDAGYTGGYVTPGCVANGSIQTNVANNTFALSGGSKAAAISLAANGTGNNLSGRVTGNKGYVTSPSKAIVARSVAIPPTPPGTNCAPYGTSNGGGGTLHITESGNAIKVKSGSQGPKGADERAGRLHAPRHGRHGS
jgi:hypothetical protein